MSHDHLGSANVARRSAHWHRSELFKMVTLLGSGAMLTVRKYGQAGIRQRNPYQTLMSISASIGQCATQRLAGLGDLPMPPIPQTRCGVGRVRARPKAEQRPTDLPLSARDGSNYTHQRYLGAQNPRQLVVMRLNSLSVSLITPAQGKAPGFS